MEALRARRGRTCPLALPRRSSQLQADVPRRQVLAFVGRALALLVGVGLCAGSITYDRFQPAAVTLGPATTLYFREPTLATRVHEAIHRRQMRDKSLAGRLASALRYPFDYRFRLDEEAEAKAG